MEPSEWFKVGFVGRVTPEQEGMEGWRQQERTEFLKLRLEDWMLKTPQKANAMLEGDSETGINIFK